MGNRKAGLAIARMAAEMAARRRPGETALELLDRFCRPYRGAHLTFRDFRVEDSPRSSGRHADYDQFTDPHPQAALGMLLVEAFAPAGLADLPRYRAMLRSLASAGEAGRERVDEAAFDAWLDEVFEPFSRRYEFW